MSISFLPGHIREQFAVFPLARGAAFFIPRVERNRPSRRSLPARCRKNPHTLKHPSEKESPSSSRDEKFACNECRSLAPWLEEGAFFRCATSRLSFSQRYPLSFLISGCHTEAFGLFRPARTAGGRRLLLFTPCLVPGLPFMRLVRLQLV